MTADHASFRLRRRARAIWVGDVLLLKLGDRELKIAPFDEPELARLHELRQGCDRQRIEGVEWMRQLLASGFLEQLAPASADPDLARFDRLLNFLSELELRGRSRYDLLTRLRNSHVAVVGLGGLASWAVYNLLCCGIGRFTLVDGDVVELSNLNRSILYREEDVGTPKVEAAARSMRRFNPRTEVVSLQLLVGSAADLVPAFTGCDLVIGLADQPPWLIKEWVSLAGQQADVSVLQASGSRVGPFRRIAENACSICHWSQHLTRQPLYGEMLRRQSRLPRGDSGALSPFGSITGGYLAMEAVRHLLGVEPLTVNRVWELRDDFTANYQHCVKQEHCGVCGDPGTELLALPSASMVAP